MTTMSAEHSANKKCDCGCDSKPDCCELECLVQPRFFCGQLLADQDLTALVDWVKAKTGLARYRHGWGIVCGLDVHCGPSGSVRVTPGYALDCCGRDIVICEETTYPISDCWQRPEDPCGNGALRRNRDDNARIFTTGAAAAGAPDPPFGFAIPSEQIQAIDLYIRYKESASDARTALARGGCGGTAGCEYTRVHEGFELYCKPAPDCLDPNEAIVAAWDEAYVEGLRALFDDIDALNGIQDERRRLDRVMGWLNEQPPQTFCFVREWLCDLNGGDSDLPERWFLDAVFLIVQDWRNEYFRVHCKGCGPDTGIRLARVWLWMRRVENRERFTTLYVDSYLPFRRMLEKDDFPAPSGFVNVAPYIWQPTNHAAVALRDVGFTDVVEQPFAAPDLVAMRSAFVRDGSMFIRHNADVQPRIILYYYVDHCGTRRVVGLTTPAILAPRPGRDPIVTNAVEPATPAPAAPNVNETPAPETAAPPTRNAARRRRGRGANA